MWQQCLWEGFELRRRNGDIYVDPPSDEYAALWPAWDNHRQMLVIDRYNHAGYGFLPTKEREDFSALQPACVVKSANWRDGDWVFKLDRGRTSESAAKRSAMMAVSIRVAGLQGLLTQTFSSASDAKFIDLFKIWAVLSTMGDAWDIKFKDAGSHPIQKPLLKSMNIK